KTNSQQKRGYVMKKIYSLENFPDRHPLIPENNFFGTNYRHLILQKISNSLPHCRKNSFYFENNSWRKASKSINERGGDLLRFGYMGMNLTPVTFKM
ncbi:MAG: hypothetical protein U9P79_08425, partial [Candidatus Cloacimonadota bacterium]|nr:hypothetical protein [Candidatus Cloacimonadota bacterium]